MACQRGRGDMGSSLCVLMLLVSTAAVAGLEDGDALGGLGNLGSVATEDVQFGPEGRHSSSFIPHPLLKRAPSHSTSFLPQSRQSKGRNSKYSKRGKTIQGAWRMLEFTQRKIL